MKQTCPEKDLHSVFIDGEMPDEFVDEYRNLLDNFPESKKDLEKMQKISNFLREDSDSRSTDDIFLQQSFERLKTKLKYTHVINSTEKKSYASIAKFPISFAAAAAVFALIFTPAHIKSIQKSKDSAIVAINRTSENEITPIAQNDVVIDGNIHQENLSTVFSTQLAKANEEVQDVQKAVAEEKPSPSFEQKTVRATSLASNRSRFTSIDVFRPEFREKTFRMKVPKIHEIQQPQETSKEE